MKLLQNNVLGGNKSNCFKAMQVLGGPTQILRGDLKLWYQGEPKFRGDLNFYGGGGLNPNDAMYYLPYQTTSDFETIRSF